MYNKINPPSSLISVKSLTGEINVNVNNEKEFDSNKRTIKNQLMK